MYDFELDVRPILRSGGEPFAAIMSAVGQLQPDQCLRLYSPFKPDPLLPVLEARGFTSTATAIGDGDWMVVFAPISRLKDEVEENEVGEPDTWPDPAYYLDCTDPDAPEGTARILSRLSKMVPGEVLFALLSVEPVSVYPELSRQKAGWIGDFDAIRENFRLMVRKNASVLPD